MTLLTPQNYDPRQVQVTYNGVPLHGFADGDYITISADADAVGAAQGADGEVVINRGPTRLHTVTLRLMQTSSSLTFIAGEAAIQAAGAVAKPLVITDINNGSQTVFDLAWIKRIPDQNYGVEAGTREVQFGGVPVINMQGVA